MRNRKDGVHGIDMCPVVERGHLGVLPGLLLDSTPRQGTGELMILSCTAVAMEMFSRAETRQRVAGMIRIRPSMHG